MKNICVFCSSSEVPESYLIQATSLCKDLAKNGCDLVWGGSESGLMKHVANTFKDNGGKIHGVSLSKLSKLIKVTADTMYVAQTLSERVDRMIDMSDAIVVLPGGSGTLDEFAHVLELKRLGYHNKPIVVFNIDGFYDGLLEYFRKANSLGLQFVRNTEGERVQSSIEQIIFTTKDYTQILSYIETNCK